MGTHHQNGRRPGQALRGSFQAFDHLSMALVSQQRHGAAAVRQVKQVHPAHRIAFRACAYLAISSSITVADSVWGWAAWNLPESSSCSQGICTITPSTIGIIFRVVTSCLAFWAERRPPDAPP